MATETILIDRGIYTLDGRRLVAVQFSQDERLYTPERWAEMVTNGVKTDDGLLPLATFAADGRFALDGQHHAASELIYTGERGPRIAWAFLVTDAVHTFVAGERSARATGGERTGTWRQYYDGADPQTARELAIALDEE
jgi:hypothetical protein